MVHKQDQFQLPHIRHPFLSLSESPKEPSMQNDKKKRRVLGAFWESSRRLRRLPRILSERAAGFRVVSRPQRGSNGDTGNVLRIIYPFHPAHPLWCSSIPLVQHHNRLTNGRQIRTRNGTRAPCPPRAPPPPLDPFIREAASVGAFHETESRGGPRPSPPFPTCNQPQDNRAIIQELHDTRTLESPHRERLVTDVSRIAFFPFYFVVSPSRLGKRLNEVTIRYCTDIYYISGYFRSHILNINKLLLSLKTSLRIRKIIVFALVLSLLRYEIHYVNVDLSAYNAAKIYASNKRE